MKNYDEFNFEINTVYISFKDSFFNNYIKKPALKRAGSYIPYNSTNF